MTRDERAAVEATGDGPGKPDFVAEVLRRLEARRASRGRYQDQGEISHGGQGSIRRVWDEDLQRHLALKAMHGSAAPRSGDATPAETRALARFLEEAHVTGQLDHPGIVPVHELGLDERGRAYFTMKLVKGEDLRAVFEKVARGEGWTQARALGVLLKVCEAMAYAHAKGVIHRDLKPANVMVGRYGEVHVMDWGLARVLGREDRRDVRVASDGASTQVLAAARRHGDDASDSPLVTMDGHIVGTPCYMSPEQARGLTDEIGPHSDVYAVGAMLYHLLAGHPPYVKPGMKLTNHAVWYRLQEGPPDPPHTRAPRAPAELLAICERAMAPDWRARYPDMGALAEDLSAYLEHRVVKAYRVGAGIELAKWIERNRRLALASGAALLALVAGLVSSLVLRSRAALNAELAHANELVALQRADEVLRLSALQRLDDLEREADRLWPLAPERIEDYARWISEAEALVAELPSYERTRAELRARGTSADGAIWSFASTGDSWWHAQLTKLIEGLQTLAGESGLLSAGISPEHGWGVRRRLDFARTVLERSVTGPEARARWEDALRSISDRDACPWYGQLELSPQVGLLPIGRDPASGLLEFAHLETGEPAVRARDGTLALSDETGLVFVLLPGGAFHMGAQRLDPALPNHDPLAQLDEGPVRLVKVAPFFLSKHEMTQGQWLRATGENPSFWSQKPRLRLPVEQVSWLRCHAVCSRLGLSLPSEAQWEYAARADSSSPWWSGEDPSALAEVANLADRTYHTQASAPDKLTEDWDDGGFGPTAVGVFAANSFGLEDVHGNVWEWCLDGYDVYPAAAPDAPVDPVRRDDRAESHVCRGGSFDNGAISARSAMRLDLASALTTYTVGLRPARRIAR